MRFRAIDEPLPGEASREWIARDRERTHAWYREAIASGYEMPSPDACRRRIAAAMPEVLPGYDAACALVPEDPLTHSALAEVDPPPLIPAGCTVRAFPGTAPAMVRNYDFHPDMTAGVIVRSRWRDRVVIGMGEGVIGLLDGMNDRGLAGAITFGGRHVYGPGFGILLILRWLLEVADDVREACEAVRGIPCAWSQNLLLADRHGRTAVVRLSPDRGNAVDDGRAVTNHQAADEGAPGSHERLSAARDLRDDPASVLEGFLSPPLFGRSAQDWLATLYTAVYRPDEGTMALHWPDQPAWRLGLDDFAAAERDVEVPAD